MDQKFHPKAPAAMSITSPRSDVPTSTYPDTGLAYAQYGDVHARGNHPIAVIVAGVAETLTTTLHITFSVCPIPPQNTCLQTNSPPYFLLSQPYKQPFRVRTHTWQTTTAGKALTPSETKGNARTLVVRVLHPPTGLYFVNHLKPVLSLHPTALSVSPQLSPINSRPASIRNLATLLAHTSRPGQSLQDPIVIYQAPAVQQTWLEAVRTRSR
ncbi:hypothetical protein F5X99DRAFT_406644 [Biscogniauxia marginata]|nr:hypothetical protein F5X99DRAFT_406644 [Biscogniauxia marginata]